MRAPQLIKGKIQEGKQRKVIVIYLILSTPQLKRE